MCDLKYSVLMSVYYKENPEYLRESIMSMMEQTVVPDEIVLMKDGQLTPALDLVLDEFKTNEILKIIELENNVGLGKALNIGLKECKNELIARMDTDDISYRKRCEKQLEKFRSNSELSVLGSAIEEFIDDPENIISYKMVKVNHKDILTQMKYKNAMNHPSVMYKKSDVLEAGNYLHCFLNEDYYLWIRMIQKGFKFENISEPLVKMRITNETYLRRGGWKFFITQKQLFKYMLENKLISVFQYIFNCSNRFIVQFMVPNKVRRFLYLSIMRKKF